MHEDTHQAPTHLRIRPLSLQNAGDARIPMGVITLFDWKIHQALPLLPTRGDRALSDPIALFSSILLRNVGYIAFNTLFG